MLKYNTVNLRKSEMTTTPVEVAEWELPLLIALHGPENVEVTGEKLVRGNPPDADDEYRRLMKRYHNGKASEKPEETSVVASVYGQFGIGNRALATAIALAVVAVEGEQPRPTSKERKTLRLQKNRKIAARDIIAELV